MATESGPKAQAALLPTVCANSSLIHRFVTSAVARKGVYIDGQDFVVDAPLCAEHALQEIRDVKVAARRLDALAECREEHSAGPADRLPGDPLQPFIHAYYGLRHLKCREQRCRLLRCLKLHSERA